MSIPATAWVQSSAAEWILIFGDGLSLRLFEADWVWANHNFANEVGPSFPELRRPEESGVRLRTGLVFNFGFPTLTPPAAACSIQPSEVMVGEPVTVTASGSNFNPKHTLTYNWASTGGKITGKDTTATVDTTGVAGGSYTVTSRVTDAKDEKGRRSELQRHFHSEGTAEESADHVLLGESDIGPGGHAFNADLHLHQS